MSRTALALLVIATAATPVAAQWSSDFPGVPRGAIPINGGQQNRTEWTLTGNSVPGASGSGDTVGGGLELGFGRSYRIQSQFEAGFDFAFADLRFVQPPSASGSLSSVSQTYMRGLAVYDIRIGAKYRPFSSLDPDGYGYQVSFGVGYQPSLKALYGYEKLGDSSRTGGEFGGNKDSLSTVFKQDPFASLLSATSVAAMGSYRSKRFLGDAALVEQSVGSLAAGATPSPTTTYNGVSLRLGASYRVTRSIALGGSYWGSGPPPWQSEVLEDVPGQQKSTQYAFLIQFGRELESGTDLMVSSPTGNFAQSLRLYIRLRSIN